MTERPGKITVPCPACCEPTFVWITRADLEVEEYRGTLTGSVTVAGHHICTREKRVEDQSPAGSARLIATPSVQNAADGATSSKGR